jgi:YfiH family protein
MLFKLKETEKWSYFYNLGLEETGIHHGFFTGASPGNLADRREGGRFLDIFQFADLAIMHQQHGTEVHIVRDGERPASGDAIIITERNVAAIVKTADCLPVILADPSYPMAAIVHAGWRGTLKGITGKTVREMVSLGAETSRIVALLGPSIGHCCYVVGEEVCSLFKQHGFADHIFQRNGNKTTLNLKKANIDLLKREGVEEVLDLNLCTLCTGNLFHSYRRGDRDRRQVNFVSLRDRLECGSTG